MLSKPICYPNVLGEVNTNASPVEPDSQESQPDETTLNARDAHLQLEKEVSVRSHIGVLQHLVIRPEQPQQQPTPSLLSLHLHPCFRFPDRSVDASPRIMPQTQKKDGFERPPTPSIRVNQVNSSSVAVLRDKSQPTKAPFSFSFSPPLSVLSPPSSEDAQDSPSPLTQSPPAFNDTMIPSLDTKRPREPTSRQTLVPIETLCRPNSPTPPVTRAVVSGSDRVQGMHTTGGAISDKISPVSSHPVSVNEDAGEPEFKRVKKL